MDETVTEQPEVPVVEMPGAFGAAPLEGAELVATTEQHGGAHEEPVLLGLEAESWVYISVTIFFVLAVVLGKVPARIAGALDERIAGVRKQLDEAKGLRAEAEALLNDAKARADAAAKDAAAMVARAETEAAELVKAGEKAAAETIARRRRKPRLQRLSGALRRS
jgi:F-type H+-transporting ATPase subunit b